MNRRTGAMPAGTKPLGAADGSDEARATARTRLVAIAAGFFAWAGGAAVFFRVTLLSGFALTTGNGGDGRLVVYLHEHLYRWLQGRAAFNSPGMYFPALHTLGYSNAFLLDLPGYAALRLLGLDPFLAQEFLLVALSFLCFWSAWHLMTRYAGVGPFIAIAAGLLITFPNSLFLKSNSGHLDSFALYYIPPLLCLAARGLRDFPRASRASVICLPLSGLLYGLLFATCFHVAWMFAVTLVIGALSAALMLRQRIADWAAAHRGAILAATGLTASGLLIGLAPIFAIYAPALEELHGRTFGAYIGFAPFPYDLINASSWNLVWGRLLDAVLMPARAQAVERALAVTPGMTVILLICLFFARRQESANGIVPSCEVRFATVAVAVLAVTWLMTVRIGSVSLFWLFYELIPGARAIRVGGRLQMLVNFWVVAAIAMLLSRRMITGATSTKRRALGAAAILLFCLVEQLNLLRGGTPRAATLAMLTNVPPPPPDCASFLITPDGGRAGNGDHNNATWISLKTGLPTLNGASGWSPPGWRLDDESIGYLDAARAWIAARKPPGEVCLYNEDRRQWSAFSQGG